MVVLAVDPGLVADVRRRQQRQQVGAEVAGGSGSRRARATPAQAVGRTGVERVARARVDEHARRQVADDSPCQRQTSRSPSTTRPITACASSQRSHTACTSARPLGRDDGQHALLGLREHDLERLQSASRSGTGRGRARGPRGRARPSRRTRRRARRRRGPAAPTSRSRFTSSSEHSIRRLPVKGSPICTLGRFSSSPWSMSCEASTDAPPMPSRPVRAPNSTTTLPGPAARAAPRRARRRTPTHMALTRQFCS